MNDYNICPLCKTKGIKFKDNYYNCPECKAVFKDKRFYPSRGEEFERYESHNNDVNDTGYQKFVNPIVSSVLRDFLPEHRGLDYGGGFAPVITKILRDNNYNIKVYDPFFRNNKSLLSQKYDYIVACEVIEHFHKPYEEFTGLEKILNDNGKIYCMTHIYNNSIPFDNWYYKNDETHVIIYRSETIKWIIRHTDFSDAEISSRLVILKK